MDCLEEHKEQMPPGVFMKNVISDIKRESLNCGKDGCAVVKYAINKWDIVCECIWDENLNKFRFTFYYEDLVRICPGQMPLRYQIDRPTIMRRQGCLQGEG